MLNLTKSERYPCIYAQLHYHQSSALMWPYATFDYAPPQGSPLTKQHVMILTSTYAMLSTNSKSFMQLSQV